MAGLDTTLRRREFLAALGSVGLAATASPLDRQGPGDEDEPAGTAVHRIDGSPVLFQFGRPVPSVDTWDGNGPSRDHRSLDGEWRFHFDPQNRGLDAGWQAPAFDDSGWRTVPVPEPWDLYDTPEFWSYDGTYGVGTAFRDGYAWYRTRFDAPESWARMTTQLGFLGANVTADVYLNGVHLGTHQGADVPFVLDAERALRPGAENVLAVRCHRRRWWSSYTASVPVPVSDATDVPPNPVDYWPYAGLVRGVYLEATPRVSVRKLLVDAREGELAVDAVLVNHREEAVTTTLRLDPGDGTGGEVVTRDVTIAPGDVRVPTLTASIPDADAWTLDSPTTYEARATLDGGTETDSLATTYGVRTVATAGSRLRVNGDPVFLKATNWHEEDPPRARSLIDGGYKRVLDRAADLGVNMLRNSHYTRHPAFYETADERGVHVVDEAQNVWLRPSQQWVQLRDYGLSRALVAAMVWHQHNHPSVALWSLQNESTANDWVYAEWIRDLREAARTLDRQARPITWAAAHPDDPAYEFADVLGLNEYFGFFYGENDDLGPALDALHERHPQKPILVTENGTWSAPELRGPPSNAASEAGTPEWQAAALRSHWQQVTDVERVDYMAGYTFWVLRDYKQRNNYNRFEYNGVSTMGLRSLDGETATLAYDTYRDAVNPRE
ncbi:glycoside hydrolase family 2 protein [Halarchaeum sp. P4]|uniref:glycoside hydrolase family 2 protein n=1 Tax=Halarchaeum sp. P4 TaxID=3421639 RepID=UPI003EBEDF81